MRPLMAARAVPPAKTTKNAQYCSKVIVVCQAKNQSQRMSRKKRDPGKYACAVSARERIDLLRHIAGGTQVFRRKESAGRFLPPCPTSITRSALDMHEPRFFAGQPHAKS